MRVSDLLGRARRDSLNGGVEGFLGDEELEDVGSVGRGVGCEDGERNYGARRNNNDPNGERRLSRELERGFMDDSSEEGDEGSNRRGMLARG